MPRKKVEKLKLKDILTDRDRNVELPTRDAKHRRDHVSYRSPRDRMIQKATPYQRRLSGDPAEDMRRHEVAREFINNGMDYYRAYCAVYGTSKGAQKRAYKMFASPWMRQLVLSMLQQTDDQEELPKEYAIQKLIQQIETNILDYMNNDGVYLNVEELKRLPRFAQEQIKKLNVTNTTRVEVLRDEEGEPLRDPEGNVQSVKVVDQHVQIELYDKQKALDTLAKVMKWIEDKSEVNLYMGDVLIEAEQRVERMRGEAIEGTANRTSSD